VLVEKLRKLRFNTIGDIAKMQEDKFKTAVKINPSARLSD
jgi:hypothetical protein